MAFLVMLQRLKPVERAVLILHDVFELEHTEIAQVVHKSAAACRQILRRARTNVALERRDVTASSAEHRHLLAAFVRSTNEGKVDELLAVLAEDAVMIADGGPDGVRFAGVRNLPRPLSGADKIAAFLIAVARRPGYTLDTRECELNGQPALVALRDGSPIAAILLGVSHGKIQSVFLQADPERLRHLGTVA
jgi:RNA polymerase sigma-70 factor (ECF subfamily)